jgi:hypothetical protein
MRCAHLALLTACVLWPARGQAEDAAAPLPAPALPIAEIVRRTIEVMDQHPKTPLVCHVISDRQILGGNGKAEDEEHQEVEETRQGEHVEWKLQHKWKNGHDVTAQALGEQRRKDEERRQKGEPKHSRNDDLMEPFSHKWSARYRFELVREEALWGRATYVVKVTALDHKETAGNGLAWIDRERFVELRGLFTPAKLPDKADWARFQLQYTLAPGGIAVPSFIKFEGGGHFLFVKKGFLQTIRWSDCH